MTQNEKLYPNYDMNIWLRSCEEEIREPLEGKVTGTIPSWVHGNLIRNGPGVNKVGPYQYGHIFDGMAILHRFAVRDGKATYQCRFLCSETWKKNMSAKRIVVTEFGTKAVPDPCRTIFDRISSIFKFENEKTDNTGVSVYPFGDQVYAMTEVPVLYRIDPESLETLEKKRLTNTFIVSHTAHPHVMPNGDVYNVGLNTEKGPSHVVVKFPYKEKGDMFETTTVVGEMKPRWRFNPAYMHSFGITDNYFVIVEQPLSISVLNMAKRVLTGDSLASSLVWYPEYETHIVLINRETGQETRYPTDTFFFMHIINCYEADGKLFVDLCSYKDAKIIDAMYVQAIEDMQGNPEYGQWVQSRPLRIEVPLQAPPLTKVQSRVIADIGIEAPRINYEKYNGRPYRYFYGIGSDVDTGFSGSLIKVDTNSGEYTVWHEPDCYPSEPVFVPHPDATEEDDGVLLSALIWGKDDHSVSLLVLDAKNLAEVARAHFETPSQVPKCFHGWYLQEHNS